MDKKTEYEEELELLERSKENILKRKNTAGILYIPSDLAVEKDESYVRDPEKSLEEELAEAFAKPVSEDGTASFMGLILKAPIDERVKYIDLRSDPTGEREAAINSRIEFVKDRLKVIQNSSDGEVDIYEQKLV
jgi:hypothetical protein